MDMHGPNETKKLQGEVALGLEVEGFLTSTVGRYLITRAEVEVQQAVEKLKTVDPTDAKAIQELQNQVYRAESVQYWLAEALQSGDNANAELIDYVD